MTNIIKICVITSEYKNLKCFMETWPYFYEITESKLNKIITSDPKAYYIKMDVGHALDLEFLTNLKEYTNGLISIIGTPEELP